jgi:hypothetical protein
VSPQEALERGREARRILDSEVYAEAVDSARARAVEEWQATMDPQEQYAAWAKARALSAVADELRRIISEGEYAEELLRRRQ